MIKNSIASNPAMAPMKDKIDDMSVDEDWKDAQRWMLKSFSGGKMITGKRLLTLMCAQCCIR